MKQTIKFNLNIVPQGIVLPIHVKQYDHGARGMEATIYDNNGTLDLSDVYNIQISVKRANGSIVILDKLNDNICDIDTTSSVVAFDLTEAMTAVAGAAKGEIIFYNEDDNRMTSATFPLLVDQAVNSAGDVTGDSSFESVVKRAVEQALLEMGLVDLNRIKSILNVEARTGPSKNEFYLDLNGDGVIDNIDQVLFAQIAAGRMPTAAELRAIDLYGDGSFTARNQTEGQRLIGIITTSGEDMTVVKATITYADGTREIKFFCQED